MNTKILRNMSYGVYVISTMDKDRPTGCIANSVMQITSSPATVAVSINHDNFTNSCIEKSGLFACSILSEKSDPTIIGTFGFQTGKEVNKFEAVEYDIVEKVPVIRDSCGYFICKVIKKMETETHTVFLGEIIEAEVLDSSALQMTYAYYHQVIKGKSPKNAPTYQPDEQEENIEKKENIKKEEDIEKKRRFVCQICGYVYEGENLPEDFICPICKQGADKFKEV